MTTDRHLERDLPEILDAIAMGPYPDYIEDVLAATAQRRQRPAWMLRERWLPMVDFARQPVLAPRPPWRAISIAAVMLALLLAAVAAFIGTQPRLPDPFGVARNGLIAFAKDGDIYSVDPVTGVSTAIVSGPENDVGPRFSRDGTHLVFERKLDKFGQLYVARSDGTDLTLVTPMPVDLSGGPFGEEEQYQFSPDGRSVLIASTEAGIPGISIAQSDGGGISRLDVGMDAYEPSFRPPDGAEILFLADDGTVQPYGGHAYGLFAIDPGSGVVRTIIRSMSGYYLGGAEWSPDGSQIVYHSWGAPGPGATTQTHVISAEGTGDRMLPAPPDAIWDAGWDWSNDGTRLLITRGYMAAVSRDPPQDVRLVVIPSDGSGPGTEIPYPSGLTVRCCPVWEWSPDDSMILGTPAGPLGHPEQQVVVDPVAGTIRPAAWTTTSDPTWQRLAP